jgi:predicted membrane protein
LERRTDEQAGEEVGGAGAAGGRARFDFGRGWRVAAYVLFAAAAVLLLLRHFEAAFAVGALGAAAWFVNVRASLIRKHDLVKVGGRNYRPRREVEKEEAAAEDDEE